mgnify:CR=1 FL=1
MTLPIQRRYTLALPTGLNVFVNMTDDETGQAQFLILSKNALLDIVNDPDPAGVLRYEFVLLKNGNQTPIRAFSTSISAQSAGRTSIGVVSMSAGQYIWSAAQRFGGFAATSVVVKYAAPLN